MQRAAGRRLSAADQQQRRQQTPVLRGDVTLCLTVCVAPARPACPPLLSVCFPERSKVVRKSIARVHTVYRSNIRAALRSKIANDAANKKGKVGWSVSVVLVRCWWCGVAAEGVVGGVSRWLWQRR
jgi:hypothetical protein